MEWLPRRPASLPYVAAAGDTRGDKAETKETAVGGEEPAGIAARPLTRRPGMRRCRSRPVTCPQGADPSQWETPVIGLSDLAGPFDLLTLFARPRCGFYVCYCLANEYAFYWEAVLSFIVDVYLIQPIFAMEMC